MKVTAETITDGQIVDLQKWACDLVSHCKFALLGRCAITASLSREGALAMSHVVDAWNARHGGEP